MKVNLMLVGFVLLCIAGWTYFDEKKQTPNQGQAVIKNFAFETLSGETASLYDNNGGVVFIHFWATWCAPCLRELPLLIKMAEQQKEGVRVYAFAVADNKEDIEQFLEKIETPLPNNFIIALDVDKNISAKLFQTIQLPETYILRPNHTVYNKIVGADEPWNSDAWHETIKKLRE